MLQPTAATAIPSMTHVVAHAAFPNGSVAIRLRDAFGPMFNDAACAELSPALGQPAASPARLAVVTILQCVENLIDREAADAVRARIDWTYAVGLERSDPGFHSSVLRAFRQRLVTHATARVLLDTLVDHGATNGVLDGKRKQRTDSSHVLAAVRSLRWLALVGETMRRVVHARAQVAPAWLQVHLAPAWIKRDGRRFDSDHCPTGEAERPALAEQIGQDGVALLKAGWADGTPPEVRTLPIGDVLRRSWVQQFYLEAETVHWRTKKQWGQPPANLMIASPEDLEASYCVKRSTEWTGYTVHVTATCATDHPRLLTDVATTPATPHAGKLTAAIQGNLAAHELLPEVHVVDEGSMDTDLLVTSQQKGVDLVGPIPAHKRWQSGGCVRPHAVRHRLGGEASVLSGRTYACIVCGTYHHPWDTNRAVCLAR